jgi:hypothetical protein
MPYLPLRARGVLMNAAASPDLSAGPRRGTANDDDCTDKAAELMCLLTGRGDARTSKGSTEMFNS